MGMNVIKYYRLEISEMGYSMKKTVYEIKRGRFPKGIRVAVVSDLHGGDPSAVIDLLQIERPDYILMPGDIFERLDGRDTEIFRNGLRLIREASAIAPVFYSPGNHEDGGTHSYRRRSGSSVMKRVYDRGAIDAIRDSGAILLKNSFVLKDGIAFGGLLSGVINEGSVPELSFLDDFCACDAPKILLCHHPEYYEKYLRELDVDLIVSGHAHGGQWRFFGRGVYAPGQGLFPKYTYGVHDGRLVVSTGLKVSAIPRFFNPPEVVFVDTVK